MSAGREVSSGLPAYALDVFEARGLGLDTILAGVGVSVDQLRDPRTAIDWRAYVRLMRNGTVGWTDDDWIEVGRGFAEHSAGRMIRAMARLFSDPAETCCVFVATGPDPFMKCLYHVTEDLGEGRVRIQSRLAPGYEPFPQQFLLAQGALEALPRLFGLPFADVELHATERAARFDVTFPRWRNPVAWLRRALTWPIRAHASRRDLRSAFAELRFRQLEITEQVEANVRSEAERSRLVTAIEQSSDGIAVIGPRGRIVYANSAFAEMMAMSPEAIVGKPASVLSQGSGDEGLLDEIAETVGRGRAWKGRYQSTWRDGSSHVRDASITPMSVEGSDEVFMVAVVHDVTREAVLDQSLQQRQRLESVGRLAGGVAHDFNNLLTVILGFAEVLGDPETSPEDGRLALREISRAATSAADLTGQLLAFGRKQVNRPRVLDLNETVRGIGAMLARLIGERISLSMALDADPARVRADPVQIEQIVTNLVVNARDAMPDGGMLTLSTRVVQPAELHDLEVQLEPRPHVVLEVSDTGAGMDALMTSQVFEPFFTTKDPGHGTGLGLSTVYGIVQQAGGEIRLRSGVGRGTDVEIYLPLTQEAAAAASPDEPSPPRWTVDKTVLLVEDEQAVRRLLRRVLEDAGLRVIPCSDGDEALDVARTTSIDILLSDVVMPRVGGIELARRLGEMQPGVRTILISGYPAPGSRTSEPPPGTVILSKPFSSARLLEALHEASA